MAEKVRGGESLQLKKFVAKKVCECEKFQDRKFETEKVRGKSLRAWKSS